MQLLRLIWALVVHIWDVAWHCWLVYFLETLSSHGLEQYLTKYDVKRLELYSQNMVDYHLIMDLIPLVARMFFLDQIDVHLSAIQSVSINF